MEKGGLYIQVPYCRRKCLYCDFYSAGEKIADWDIFFKSLKNELITRESEFNFEIETLYLGGGTPSLAPKDYLGEFIDYIKENLKDSYKVKEFTIEVNPEDLTEETCEFWKSIGINRISMGIQSFNDEELKLIGRNHGVKEAEKALELLKHYFDNIGIDLIFGLPNQTPGSLMHTINQALTYRPDHISVYSLMLEEGTALTYLVNKKRLTLPDEGVWITMWDLLSEKLKEAGYIHYEISNYAQKGKESMHNTLYWQGRPYIGLGPSAHSYDGERRRKSNRADLKGYLKFYGIDFTGEKIKDGNFGFADEEILTDEELKEEFIMTRLRMNAGIFTKEFIEKFGENEYNHLKDKCGRFIKGDFIKIKDGHISLTQKGFMISDNIIISLL